MPRKVKIKDEERELEDEVADLGWDETGVPYRNRAAEWRRKYEKAEKEMQAERDKIAAELADLKKKSETAQAPYQPGVYQGAQAPQNYAHQAYAPQPGMSADEIRRAAREEALRIRQEEEFRSEQERLRDEWADFDDKKDEVYDSVLKDLGYSRDDFEHFGPRDIRLVKRAFEGKAKKPASRRSPQEVVLDTGGGNSVLEEEAQGDQWAKKNWNDPKVRAEVREWAKNRAEMGED